MKKITIPKPKPVGLQHIELVLKSRKINFVSEHQFLSDRKFRFVIAMPEKKMRQGMDDYLEYGTTVFQGPFNNRKVSKVRKNLTTVLS